MFDRTIVGAAAPVILIDSPARPGCKLPARIAARTQIIFHGATRSSGLRIVDGCIALFQELADGRRGILDILGPGKDVSAELLDLRQCKAITLTLTQVETIESLREPSSLEGALRQMLCRAQEHALLLGRKSAVERVASAILDLAAQFARRRRNTAGGRATFTLFLTRADLADWLGLTLQTVSRCFGVLKRSKLIAFDQPESITIRDRAALEAIALGRAGRHAQI
jgi:CRP/FNR family transcriptional regulator